MITVCPYLSLQSVMVVTCDDTMQGGFLLIETKALETFIRFFDSYLHCLSNIVSAVHSFDVNTEKEEHDVDMTGLDVQCGKDYIQERHTPPQAKREHKEALILDVSQFSIVLLIEDEKGNLLIVPRIVYFIVKLLLGITE